MVLLYCMLNMAGGGVAGLSHVQMSGGRSITPSGLCRKRVAMCKAGRGSARSSRYCTCWVLHYLTAFVGCLGA